MKNEEKINAVKRLGEIEKLLESAYNILHTANSLMPHKNTTDMKNIQNLIEGDHEYQQKIKRYADVIDVFSNTIQRQLLQR